MKEGGLVAYTLVHHTGLKIKVILVVAHRLALRHLPGDQLHVAEQVLDSHRVWLAQLRLHHMGLRLVGTTKNIK